MEIIFQPERMEAVQKAADSRETTPEKLVQEILDGLADQWIYEFAILPTKELYAAILVENANLKEQLQEAQKGVVSVLPTG